ncbi:Flagellar associated protein [Phytophthora megakarya]|uniref:Flagellar associated protein n=1 Tax=Phytophthora megakarya TaxID=4795 RepID=A0A225WWT8_9STRA|nr:Flagellar associated protein [Phytophthora megakarya]
MVGEAQNERVARVEAVLALKHDLDTSAAKIGAQSSAMQARNVAERAHQARTQQSLLNQGKNPYEVTRLKVVEREAKQERVKLGGNVQDRETKLLDRLEAEKLIQRRREKVEAENRAYERKYQREMGRAAQEERTNAYLLSRTGKEALDPTGKLVRVYPSQETTLKDHTFGLGHSAVITPEHRRRVISNVNAKSSHAGAAPNSMLLPRRKRDSQQDSESHEGRSVLEERQLAKARQREKDSRFSQSQVVWGKTFSGNAFLANPPMLWFKDFDVRCPLILGFTLTNISNTFNQFRLLPMDDDVIELFDIVYEKPGRMSAGMSCFLKMTFTGMENRDLDTTLSVAAPTGVFQLPVRCTCKKAVPILSKHEVHFPETVAGERSTISLTLANDGALPLNFRLRRITSAPGETVDSMPSMDEAAGIEDGDSVDIDDPLSSDEQELVDRVLETTLLNPEGADEPVRFKKRGVVAPYSSCAVFFTFAPAAPMNLENQQFVLEFSSASSSGISSPDLRRLAHNRISISGVALQVPIFVSCSRLDFRCCAYGKLYRHQLIVCNRGKVAMKIQFQVPKPLAGFIEFNPGFGFIQAAVGSQEGIFRLQVKFRPEERIWKRIERAGLGSRDLGMLAVPVQVLVPDQVVPVYFLLTARLTHTALQLTVLIKTGSSDQGIHFGVCCIGHSVSHELTITNAARIPQRVGITTLPKDVSVADSSEGVGFVLLPDEARTLRVVYTPKFPGALETTGAMKRTKPILTLWSSTFNQKYMVQCSGSGVASDLVFSQSAVRLGATPLGQTKTCNVIVTNQSDSRTHLVELRMPPEATPFLRITPLVTRLAPFETVRLEIDFEPTEDIFKLVNNCYFEAQSTDKNDQVSEPRRCHHTWTILCYHQVEVYTDGNISSKVETPMPLQGLEVRTTVVEPFLIPSTTVLDFGQVAIGQTLAHDFTLETTPCVAENILLRAQPLHILGAFRLIGALREVPGNASSKKKRAILVEFEPRTPLVYEDELELSAVGVNIRVRLRGEGINPSLSISPVDGKLDFQDVLARTRNVRELVLANGSTFPLAFSIVELNEHDIIPKGETDIIASRLQNRESMSTTTGLPAFTFSPTSAIIPENGFLSVQVVFQPDHQRPGHYSRRYRIQVPNENEQHIISLSGRCWENQLYVFAPTADEISPDTSSCISLAVNTKKRPLLTPHPVEDLFDLPPSISLTQLPSSIGVNELPATALRKPVSSFVLTFTDDETRHSSRGDLTSAKSNSNLDSTSPGWISKTLFIGSTTPSSGMYGGLDEVTQAAMGGSAGSFELVVDAASPYSKLFTLEPARGAIAAGQQLAVQRRPDLAVVQWVQVRVQCILKGGALWRVLPAIGGASVAPTAPTSGTQQKGANVGAGSTIEGVDTRIVTVILRARLEL